MQKFIISVKEKNTGRDVISPYIVNSLDGLGNYSERISSFSSLLSRFSVSFIFLCLPTVIA